MSILNSLPNVPDQYQNVGNSNSPILNHAARMALDLPQRVLQSDDSDEVSLSREASGRLGGRSLAIQALLTSFPLLLVDIIAVISCVAIGLCVSNAIGFRLIPDISYLSMVLASGTIIIFSMLGLYASGGMHPIYEFRQVIIGSTIVFLLFTVLTLNSSVYVVSMVVFPLMMVAVPTFRKVARSFLARTKWWGVRVVVINCNKRVEELYSQHLKNGKHGLVPVGFIQNVIPEDLSDEIRQHYLGTTDDIQQAVKKHKAHFALLHRCSQNDRDLFEFAQIFLKDFSKVILIPDDHRLPSLWSLGQRGGVCIEDRLLSPSAVFIKRTMDVVVSLSAILVFSPVLIGIAIWCKLSDPGPLFFGHKRIGKHGKRFKAWKFRTMRVNADEILKKTLAENPEMRKEWEETYKLKNDPRITRAGHFLRKSSLDELPQLWNVLIGEMSLVGPRPIVVGEVEKYEDKFSNYLRVIPGVTGFWQVSGRNLTTYERRVELDDFYVRNWSIWFDIYILIRTVKTVLFREGAF
ncbi:MAG: undecaprenyl-phosphate galactose phosphotransferase WbaP [Planctomycetota bacterium]